MICFEFTDEVIYTRSLASQGIFRAESPGGLSHASSGTYTITYSVYYIYVVIYVPLLFRASLLHARVVQSLLRVPQALIAMILASRIRIQGASGSFGSLLPPLNTPTAVVPYV